MNNIEINDLVDEIMGNNIINKHLYKYTWLSGSSTKVFPISIYKDDKYVLGCQYIQLQIDTKRNVFKNVINKYMSKYEDLFEYIYFTKTDDSCPSKLVFRFKRKE